MTDPSRPRLLERLSALIMREPGDREQLVKLLRSAYSRNLLDADAMSIIEGALTVSEMQVRDIMIPRAQVDFIDINEPVESFIPQVMSTAHSRFPVIDQNRDDVIGVLLAKDLLRHYAGEEAFNVREMLRPAVFVPEAKRLNVLLREFRASRNHMAIVVDEYGGTAGVVTIEDILEEIVGEITDEYDTDEVPAIQEIDGRTRRLSARLPVEDLEELYPFLGEPDGPGPLAEALAEADVDTVGGLLAQRLGKVPLPGSEAEVAGLRLRAEGGKDARGRLRITSVLVEEIEPEERDVAGA
jgi:magnesium and cobalt transporter